MIFPPARIVNLLSIALLGEDLFKGLFGGIPDLAMDCTAFALRV
jgi:hypothetical protein